MLAEWADNNSRRPTCRRKHELLETKVGFCLQLARRIVGKAELLLH